MAEPDWKKAMAQGRPIEPRVELSPELLNRMGIHSEDAESVFSTLKKNRRMTWGTLLVLKTKAKAIEVAEDEVHGIRLWNFIEEQRVLGRVCPLPRFSQPTGTKWELQPYAQPIQFNWAYKNLRELVCDCPTPEKRGVGIVAVFGPMGVGKTRFVHELMLAVCNSKDWSSERSVIRLYLTLSTLNIPWSEHEDQLNILAKTLVFALSPGKNEGWEHVTWTRVLAQSKQDMGSDPVVLLNIDESQTRDPRLQSLKRAILKACNQTMQPPGAGLVVIPLLSGVFDISRDSLETSDFATQKIHLRALKEQPLERLEEAFCTTLLIPRPIINQPSAENLKRLFNMCGGFPYLVDTLREVLLDLDPTDLAKLRREGTLTPERAQNVFEEVLRTISSACGPIRWHSFLAIKLAVNDGEDEDATERASFDNATILLMRRVLLDILTERSVEADALILNPILDDGGRAFVSSKIKYKELHESGIVAIVDSKVTAPLMIVLAMDDIAHALPKDAEIRKPFIGNWLIHEHLSIASLYIRLLDAKSPPPGCTQALRIQDLRPGAQSFGFGTNDRALLRPVTAPKVVFTFWESYLDSAGPETPLQRGSDGRDGDEHFNEIVVAITREGERAIHGVTYMPEDKVLILTQTKARGRSKSRVGDADRELANSDVKRIIEQMREHSKILVGSYPQLKDCTLVYDISTNKRAPQGESTLDLQSGFLQTNERALVVRGDRLVRAFGESLSTMREVKRVRRTGSTSSRLRLCSS